MDSVLSTSHRMGVEPEQTWFRDIGKDDWQHRTAVTWHDLNVVVPGEPPLRPLTQTPIKLY